MVKLFTMIKDEVDVIRDWIVYHGSMFGYSNLYIIDNFSTDGTYEVIKEYEGSINIFRYPEYELKGIHMRNLINGSCPSEEIAFPIDSDEFVVLYQNGQIIVDKQQVNDYFLNLPPRTIYKANYILSTISNQFPQGFDRATVQSKRGLYQDYGHLAKTFFKHCLFAGGIDHGNHIPNVPDYLLTDICLVHYHHRSIEQMKKKIMNNVSGLGYSTDPEFIRDITENNKSVPGVHHVHNLYHLQRNSYGLPLYDYNDGNLINIEPLAQRIEDGCF